MHRPLPLHAASKVEHGEAQRLRHRETFDQVSVRLLHEGSRARIVDAPQGDDDGGGARHLEAPPHPHHAVGCDLAARRVAGAHEHRSPCRKLNSCFLFAALHVFHLEACVCHLQT